MHRIAARMIRERDALLGLGKAHEVASRGTLTIATTHTQARYALPALVAQFRKDYPDVHLVLHQSTPSRAAHEVAEMDVTGALEPFDLKSQLSSNRTQGVPNMIALVKEHASRLALG